MRTANSLDTVVNLDQHAVRILRDSQTKASVVWDLSPYTSIDRQATLPL